MVLLSAGKLSEAEALLREALEGNRRAFGDEHQDTLVSIANLARLLQAQGEIDEAELLFGRALEGLRRTLGDEHPYTLKTKRFLEVILEEKEKSKTSPVEDAVQDANGDDDRG